jgi:hypothetical protein
LEFPKDFFEFEFGTISVKLAQREFGIFGGENLIPNMPHGTGT